MDAVTYRALVDKLEAEQHPLRQIRKFSLGYPDMTDHGIYAVQRERAFSGVSGTSNRQA